MIVRIEKVKTWFLTLSLFVSVSRAADRNHQVLFEMHQKGMVEKLILSDQSVLTLPQLRRLGDAECPHSQESLCFLNVQTTRQNAAQQNTPTDHSCHGTLRRLLEGRDHHQIQYPVEGQVLLKQGVGSVYRLRTSADRVENSVAGRNWAELKTPAGSCKLRFLNFTELGVLTLYIVCPQVDEANVQALLPQVQAWRQSKDIRIFVRTLPIFNEDTAFPWIPPLLTRGEMSQFPQKAEACQAVYCEVGPNTKCDKLP